MTNFADDQYKSLLKKVLQKGNTRPDRTGTGTISLFGEHIELDVSTYLACITIKKTLIKSVVAELIWFLRGSTNVKELIDLGSNIWNGNSTREFLDDRGLNYPAGFIGPGYGHQWRNSGGDYTINLRNACVMNIGVDQIRESLKLLMTDPASRRIIINAWNPIDIDKMALPPCHMMSQFYTEVIDDEQYLSMQVYQRSADLFLGVPFNFLSYSIMLHLYSLFVGMKPYKLYFSYGDSHIYSNHLDQARSIIDLETKQYPTIKFSDKIMEVVEEEHETVVLRLDAISDLIDRLKPEDFIIEGYDSHPFIRAPMAV